MILTRRQFLHLAAGASALPALTRAAWAQTYPSRPVRLIVGFASGGPADITARLVGHWLSERMGQQFIIEKRPGASTNIATEAVVRAPPDGHALLLVAPANAVNATLYDKLNFVFLRDIAPVAGLTRAPYLFVVNPSVPATIPEFIAYAKANPGKLSMGITAAGTQVAGELFKTMAGIDVQQVPYSGDAPGLTDLIGGRIEIFLGGVAASIEHIKAGRIRALAVTTATRSQIMPSVPALHEFLPGYEASIVLGVGAPKGTSAEIINKLNREINAGLADPNITARFSDLGASVLAVSPAEFSKLIADETEKWGKVIRAANIKAQ